jgi:hypothetical protein
MDEGWVEMEVQSWHLHYRILCQMVINQSFEEGAWPFGHFQPKLWAKEGLGVKLAI